MNTNNERFLLKVVDMYYKEELSQETIAQKLNISRTTVSRTLTRAKKEGYVKILINYPANNPIDMEKELERKFGITEAMIAMTKDEALSDFLVAEQASEYLIRVLKSNMVMGITWGRTMKRVIDYFGSELGNIRVTVKDVEIVPFQGTSHIKENANEEYRLTYSNILATKVAELINGVSYSLSAPMFVSNEKIKKILEQEKDVSMVLKKAREADIALFGIGNLSNESSLAASGGTTFTELQDAAQKGGTGEIIGRIYDKNGKTMDLEMNRKQMGISLDEMKKIPIRVGIAYGRNKVDAIQAAMKGGIVNVLITDSITAQSLLEKEEKEENK